MSYAERGNCKRDLKRHKTHKTTYNTETATHSRAAQMAEVVSYFYICEMTITLCSLCICNGFIQCRSLCGAVRGTPQTHTETGWPTFSQYFYFFISLHSLFCPFLLQIFFYFFIFSMVNNVFIEGNKGIKKIYCFDVAFFGSNQGYFRHFYL